MHNNSTVISEASTNIVKMLLQKEDRSVRRKHTRASCVVPHLVLAWPDAACLHRAFRMWCDRRDMAVPGCGICTPLLDTVRDESSHPVKQTICTSSTASDLWSRVSQHLIPRNAGMPKCVPSTHLLLPEKH